MIPPPRWKARGSNDLSEVSQLTIPHTQKQKFSEVGEGDQRIMDLVFLLIKNLIPLGAYELREKEIKELTIIEFQKRSNAFDSILNEDLINAGEEKV